MHTLLTFAIALLMLGISSSMKMFIEMRYFVFLRKQKISLFQGYIKKLRTYEPNKIPKYSYVLCLQYHEHLFLGVQSSY